MEKKKEIERTPRLVGWTPGVLANYTEGSITQNPKNIIYR
jgi:hypothetical protein